MIVCVYQYNDGICGISQDAHARHGVARTGHSFEGAEIRREMDASVGEDGKAVFTRPLESGSAYVVPFEVLQAVRGIQRRGQS